MNIAIVGEGPIGSIVCLFFIYYKIQFNINELNIFFYKSRNIFKRRHIVKIKRDTLIEIEGLINSCRKCLTKNNDNEFIDLSIRCLEFLLHENINDKYVNIIENKFTENDINNENKYQNIFLCDGFASKNRLFYIYNNIEYKPLRVVFKTPLLILYGNLDSSDSPIETTCINNSVIKKQYLEKQLLEYDIEMDKLVALISIIYNINIKYNTYDKILSDTNMREINLWVEGYDNYDFFLSIFDNTIEYLNKIDDKQTIISIFEKNGVFISNEILNILDNKYLIPDIYEKYKIFLRKELIKINGLDNPFIIHNVMPNCTTFGIILDDSAETLVFAKKNTINEHTYTSWLIGDSANSYPPGVSLQNGIKDIFILVPNFIRLNFLQDLVIPFTQYDYFECEDNLYLYNEKKICKKLQDLKFMGGYLFDNNHNNDEISINILIEKINTKKCSDNDNNLINIYNNYQVNMFFYNLINYVCYTNTFLNQPKNGGKTKSRKTKSRKIKSRKIKSRKNSKKYKT